MYLVFLALLLSCGAQDPSWDHQTTTYNSQYQPYKTSDTFTYTPFFSPDHSIDTITKFVEGAQSSLDIYSPGWSSWSNCTGFNTTQCQGCDPSVERTDEFPVFAAVLNALHRGVTVRLVTNGFGETDCPGMIGPLTFLQLNGMQIQLYASTTFMHTKFMAADGKRVWVGSINFSWTSFMKNREAGIVIDAGRTGSGLYNWYENVFSGDFNAGVAFQPTQTYSASEMAVITNSAPVPVVIPPPYQFDNPTFVSPYQPVSASGPLVAYASPDFAKTTLLTAMNATQSSLGMVIYQITDPDICSAIINLYNNNVQLQILVSNKIFSYDDWKAAAVCYKQMYEAGIRFRKTEEDTYTFTHAKFWIQDGQLVGLSSGNLSPTDYPEGGSFPVYGSSGWVDVNRDLNLLISAAPVVAQFSAVLNGDWQYGTEWTPERGVVFASA